MAAAARVICGLARLGAHLGSRHSRYVILNKGGIREPWPMSASFFLQQHCWSSSGIRTIFRTSQDDPALHTLNNEGLFYDIPENDYKIYLEKTASPLFNKSSKAFNERSIMVRQPGLEILDNLKLTNYEMPALRYVLYGRPGAGKSMSLAHVLHYCASQGWLILHVPWASHYSRYYRETQPSVWKEGRIDQPYEAVEWLSHFFNMNSSVIREYDLRIRDSYTWSKREVSETGSTFSDVIDFALSRPKYATDVFGVILKEIRKQACGKGMKVLVAIDGVNAFWEPTKVKVEQDRSQLHDAGDLAIVHNWKKMIKNNWTGGAVVTTVDSAATFKNQRVKEYMPLALLGKDGFEWLDPHIPVFVPFYSDKEIRSSIEYYLDRKWITNPAALTEDGKKELMFLSNHNPYELYNVTRRW